MRDYLLLLVIMLFSVQVWAEEAKIPAGVENAMNKLKLTGSVQNYEVSQSPIKGLYEVLVNGNDILYASEDGEHLLVGGDLFKFDGSDIDNLTEQRRNSLRLKELDGIEEKEMIVFAPEGETKYTVSVFTDVDCPYCTKIHNEVPKLNKAGVKVRYLAFPRAGVGSPTYKTMVSVWCAKDQQDAMTRAKNQQKVEPATCDNPVDEQYKMGQRIGVRGTPALLLPNGKLLPGYMPARKLVKVLEEEAGGS